MRRLFSLFSILVLAATGAEATSYVLVSDQNMVDQSPAIVRVRIDDRVTGTGAAATQYRATVLEALKGSVGPEITLSVPGGTNAAGMTWHVFGAPRFAADDEALLFVRWRDDATYGIEQLMLGAFHERNLDGQRVAVRNLAEATQLGRAPGATQERARSLEAFSDWIRDRVAGVDRPADYFVEIPLDRMRSLYDEFTIIHSPGIRFFEFDTGGKVTWHFNANGTPLPEQAFKQALNAWNAEKKTPINQVYGGKTSATKGLDDFDELNVLLGGDPNNEMSGKFSCAGGGVLAVGGPWFDDTLPLKKFNGKNYHKTFGADIVVNDGADCRLDELAPAGEVFTHENGHALGLGHSCGDSSSPPCSSSTVLEDATMKAFAHFDGRGAAIREDDVAGIRTLYKPNADPGPTPPAAPTGLLATAVSATQVTLGWNDQSTNETGFAIERKTLGAVLSASVAGSVPAPAEADFAQIAEVGAGVEIYTAKLLSPANHYAFRVRALGGANGDSGYSNEVDVVTNGVPTPCVEDANTLCLENGRFTVTVTWETKDGETGVGVAQLLTDQTGYFWFFNEKNVEIVIKALDACKSVFDSFWVYASGLTDVGVQIVVMDSETGAIQVYDNAVGEAFKLVQDTQAFKTCDS
jgi:hypothetical protein